MTDRELLEAAAKAAGITLAFWPHGVFSSSEGSRHQCPWNPLEDDGDALRLAVQLGLQLDLRWQRNEVHVYGNERIDEGVTGDPYAATRRAIVRAAASLGERGKG